MSSNAGGGDNNEDEADVPMAQRRRFTRVEMARVLMERNQYKVSLSYIPYNNVQTLKRYLILTIFNALTEIARY